MSIASIWEIAIKSALTNDRRGEIPFNGYQAISLFAEAGFDQLGIEPHHVAAVGELPHLHGDPFDRLLVAQARSEGMTLVTHDIRLAAYGDFILVV